MPASEVIVVIVVGQFCNSAEKIMQHQGHEVSRRLCVSRVSFVPLLVKGLAK